MKEYEIHNDENFYKAFEFFELGNVSYWGEIFYGEGVKQDDEQAAVWYEKAAELGYVDAKIKLDLIRSEKENFEEALKQYKERANQGYSPAASHLGFIYFYGKGVEQDYKEALKWFKAEGDHLLRYHALGYMYEKGLGTEKDIEQAIKYYKKAADQGCGPSMYRLQELK